MIKWTKKEQKIREKAHQHIRDLFKNKGEK